MLDIWQDSEYASVLLLEKLDQNDFYYFAIP